MDENLGYTSEDNENERRNSSQWQLTHESVMSMERESSKLFLQYRNYHLHLIQKKEPPLERPVIPSSKHERLSYFRNYVSSPNKTQIACMHLKSFNGVIWEYIMNSWCKSLQHTFVNIFLASFVPEEHLFVSKMVPFMHGTKFCFIITGLIEVIAHTVNIIFLLDYVAGSIFFKNPWNRCPTGGYKYYISENTTINIKCYNIPDFAKRIHNQTVQFYLEFYYIEEGDELLQLTQIEFFRQRYFSMSKVMQIFYTCFIFGILALCHKQIFKKNFWRVLNIIHWCVIAMDIASFVYLLITFHEDQHNINNIEYTPTTSTVAFSHSDIDFFSESTTAPPVVHVLTARSTQEIVPGRDSAIIILSNAICFLFRAWLSFKVKRYCESLAKVPIFMPLFSVNAWLYIWPMYFSTFYLGDLYTLIFLALHFSMEIMTTVVTFQCLVEVIVSEWSKLQRWSVSFVLIVVAIGSMIASPVKFTLLLAFCKSTATMLECIAVYCMYPVFRLIDDIYFHYGSPIHGFRVQLLLLVPTYYLYKYYTFYNTTLIYKMSPKPRENIQRAMVYAFTLTIVPLVLGMIYTSYKYVVRYRRNWRRMFAPAEDWGPREFNVRQLRKDYDSRTYNSSEAPRNLSRHIIGKAESKAYRLDIRYDPSRRSTVPIFLQTENERKDL